MAQPPTHTSQATIAALTIRAKLLRSASDLIIDLGFSKIDQRKQVVDMQGIMRCPSCSSLLNDRAPIAYQDRG
jgi:cytochrome c-type biogenesis protein CcmH/NrfF